MRRSNISRLFIYFIFLIASAYVWAETPIESLLQQKQSPPGVVFEIVTGKSDGLKWALPEVKSYIDQIHRRFPDTHIAVVTHGREMFALEKSKTSKTDTQIKSLTQQLAQDGVTMHVCGTYAEHKGVSEEEFPDYVNVAAEGPAQIKDYIAVGYYHVKLTRPMKN